MKIILLPLIKLITTIVLFAARFSIYSIAVVLIFIWDFSILPYKKFFKERKDFLFGRAPRIDNTPFDTLKRYWNFDYFDV